MCSLFQIILLPIIAHAFKLRLLGVMLLGEVKRGRRKGAEIVSIIGLALLLVVLEVGVAGRVHEGVLRDEVVGGSIIGAKLSESWLCGSFRVKYGVCGYFLQIGFDNFQTITHFGMRMEKGMSSYLI